MNLELRSYQTESIEALREGVRQGHKRQMLAAPTGSGKTVCATYLMEEAERKMSRAWFIVDRVALVSQTSAMFDAYGIKHGVIQAQHWRFRPWERIQVISSQTLARRSMGDIVPDLVIVDEAHTLYKSTVDFIKAHPDIITVGLSATPFTRGLGKLFTNVVNVTTTDKLIEEKYLAPVRVYAGKAADMTGAPVKSTGEWEEAAMETRGLTVIGDIVSEWIAKTNQHFNGPVKTIVFSATVAHGEELCRRFQEAGFNFQQVSYKDGNDERRAKLIEEFRKPDSEIMGLVSCEALAKGFDVPDILCLAEGSRVLTHRGVKAIEEVTLSDKLWDGIEFVAHGGAIYKGTQHVIEYAGLTATPDHQVKTAQGWRTFGQCAAEQIAIVTTGFGRTPIRESEGYFSGGRMEGSALESKTLHPVRLRDVWDAIVARARLGARRAASWLRSLSQSGANAAVAGRSGEGYESPLHEPGTPSLPGLWWPWHRIPVLVGSGRGGMDQAEPRLPGAATGHSVRSHQQRRALRSRQSPLGVEAHERRQYPAWRLGGDDAQVSAGASGNQICRQDAAQPAFSGLVSRADHRAVSPQVRQTQRRVWDILDAGPRNRFTCEGLLVHNCGIAARPYRKSLSGHIQQIGRVMRSSPGKEYALWLDHSGNFLRFWSDTEEVFANGIPRLDDRELDAKVRPEPDEDDKAKLACGACHYVMGGRPTCPMCGWERPKRANTVLEIDGELHELNMKKSKASALDVLLQDRESAQRMIWGHALDRKGGDITAAEKFALAQWRNIYGTWPKRAFRNVEPMDPHPAIVRKIQQGLIAWAKRKEAAA